jgi:hypothetical protein
LIFSELNGFIEHTKNIIINHLSSFDKADFLIAGKLNPVKIENYLLTPDELKMFRQSSEETKSLYMTIIKRLKEGHRLSQYQED